MLLNDKKDIRILFVLPSLGLAGAERVTVDLVNALAMIEGYYVHLFTFERNLDLKDAVDCVVKFHHHPRCHKFDFSNISRIAELIDREEIDIVHCTLQIALLFGVLGVYRSQRRPKLIDAIHTTINRNIKYELFDRMLYVPLMRRCDQIIAVCDNQKAHWIKKYPFLADRIVTVHNGIDVEYYADNLGNDVKGALRRELGIQDGELVVGMVAGFRSEKNHEEVFIAFSKLVQQGLPLKLLLVGDGERLQLLQAKSKELGIENRIIWVGFTSEAKKYISIFDTGVLFSNTESFSMAILEMLAMGKPVVAADLGGTCEMIQDGINGYLVQPHDVTALTNTLDLLFRNPQLRKRLGNAARQAVLENFTKNVMVERTISVLNQVHAE